MIKTIHFENKEDMVISFKKHVKEGWKSFGQIDSSNSNLYSSLHLVDLSHNQKIFNNEIEIIVYSTKNKKIKLTVNKYDLVNTIYDVVFDIENSDNILLIYNGLILDSMLKISDYHIRNFDIIMVSKKL